jgi:hypothetical protein
MDWVKKEGKDVAELNIESASQVHNVDYSKPIKNGPNSVGFDYYLRILYSLIDFQCICDLFDSFLLCFKFINSYNDDLDNYQIVISNKIKTKKSFKNYLIYDNLFVKINKNSKYFVNIVNNKIYQVGKQAIERDNTIINELMSIEQKPIKQN